MLDAEDTKFKSTSLVTGGCGFIGHHLVHRLLLAGHRVTVLDSLATGSLANLPEHDNLTFIEGDVLDRDAVFLAGRDAQIVFHLASVVGMRQVCNHGELTYQTSTKGTQNVLDATRDVPVVLFSSSAVYGLNAEIMNRENQQIFDQMPLKYDGASRGYATGKWKMEQIGQKSASAGRNVMILRPYNVIGPGQSEAYGMVLPHFISQAYAGQPLTIFDDGKQTRCFSGVKTFIDCTLRIIEEPSAWQQPLNVFNVGTDQSTSIIDLANIVLDLTFSNSEMEFVPYEQAFEGKQDVRARVPDTQRLNSLIGMLDWPDIRTIVQDVLSEIADKLDDPVKGLTKNAI